MTLHSALYEGAVQHRRLSPKIHSLRYPLFWMLLDLDELPSLNRALRLFSYNRLNLVSFFDRDHGDGSCTPLRDQIERILTSSGIAVEGGSVRLLCMPRIFGYAFNPLSTYFCYSADGQLAAVLYQVHNTFGERHSYLFRVSGESTISLHCAKSFHVSPFMDMQMAYWFRVTPPASRVMISIRGTQNGESIILASLSGERRELTSRTLLRALTRFPLATFKVTAAIHWHALRLWLKGIAIRTKPAPPPTPVTFVRKEN